MALMPCPECERSISTRARACPHCGCPFTEPWTAVLRRAWKEGFSHAWIAAVGVPALYLLAALGDWAPEAPQMFVGSLPWLLVMGVWGFGAGLVAVGAAAIVRAWSSPKRGGAELWRWSLPAVLTVVAAFGAWMSVTVL